MLPSSRTLALLGFLTCVSLIGGALYFQHGLGFEPCPLCIMQRIIYLVIGLLCLIAFLHNPGRTGYRTYTSLMILSAMVGIGITLRQLYLQNLPPELVPACAPPLAYLLETASAGELLNIFLSGTGDCAEVQWSMFGITIPGWSLIAYSSFFLLGLVEIRRTPKEKRLFG